MSIFSIPIASNDHRVPPKCGQLSTHEVMQRLIVLPIIHVAVDVAHNKWLRLGVNKKSLKSSLAMEKHLSTNRRTPKDC
eukprot:1801031-Amphidinium_carterae.2